MPKQWQQQGEKKKKYLQPGADNLVNPMKSTIYSQAILDNDSGSGIYPACSLSVPRASFRYFTMRVPRTLWMTIVDSDLPIPIDDDQ